MFLKQWKMQRELTRICKMSYHQNNRAGLESITTHKDSTRYQKLVSSVVEKSDNEKLHVKSVLLSLQLQWTRCCNYIKLDLSWKISLPMPQPLLFSIFLCLGTTYDTLPSPSNLYRQHIFLEVVCFLCFKQVCTFAHVLGTCRVP